MVDKIKKVRAELDIPLSGDKQCIRLIGTSYSGEKPVNLRLALYLVDVTSGKATLISHQNRAD